ncbi:baseplate complex protein [Pseudomonas sp. HK3]
MRLNNTDLKVKSLNVSMVLSLPTEDAGGQTSSTSSIDKGIKPKLLNCSCEIAQTDVEAYRELIKLAESVDDKGNRTVFDIVDKTAEASDIRQVTFMDAFTASEDAQYRKWKIRFTLREKNSIAEAKQKQEQQSSVLISGETTTKTTGTTSTAAPVANEVASQDVKISSFEGFMEKAEKLVGGLFESGGT